jgi:hypothetical protein
MTIMNVVAPSIADIRDRVVATDWAGVAEGSTTLAAHSPDLCWSRTSARRSPR